MGIDDLVAWREACSLAANVLKVAEEMRGMGSRAAAEQLVDAAESIPANIAEGYGRGVTRDCLRFLRIARGSCNEVESRLKSARDGGRLPSALAEPLIHQVRRVRWLIDRFADSVERRRKDKRA